MKNIFWLLVLILSTVYSKAFGQTCPQKESHRQVLILPPTGGANMADKSLFDSLCALGHQTSILNYQQKSGLTTDLGVHDRLSREVLVAIDHFIGQNPKPTAVIGASLGGLYASLAFSYSKTNQTEFKNLAYIDRIVLTVAGGPLWDILTFSQGEEVKKQRELRMKALGFSDLNRYRETLQQNIFYDTQKWATASEKAKVLMFNSTADEVVPSASQESLWSAWGKPEVVLFTTDHQWTVGWVYFFYTQQISNFLK
jgi:hypothetical protein